MRIATHPNFKDFVLGENARLRGTSSNGRSLEGSLEFFDAGGDPKNLMEYMVKSISTLLPRSDCRSKADPGPRIVDQWRYREEAENDRRDAGWLLPFRVLARSRLGETLCGRCSDIEPTDVRPLSRR